MDTATGNSARYVSTVTLRVSCLTTQSSVKISDSVAFVVVDKVGTDISRQSRY